MAYGDSSEIPDIRIIQSEILLHCHRGSAEQSKYRAEAAPDSAMTCGFLFHMSVDGRAVIYHPAERATMNVTVESRATEKVTASDDALAASKAMEEMLRELSPQDESPGARAAAPLQQWTKTAISSTSVMDRAPQFQAEIKFNIKFQDLTAIRPFATKLYHLPCVVIRSFEWSLTDATTASYQSRLRREAALDAMAKAKDYCETLGCATPRPTQLQEKLFYNGIGQGYGTTGIEYDRAENFYGGSGRYERLDFMPQDVQLIREVTVKFDAG